MHIEGFDELLVAFIFLFNFVYDKGRDNEIFNIYFLIMH